MANAQKQSNAEIAKAAREKKKRQEIALRESLKCSYEREEAWRGHAARLGDAVMTLKAQLALERKAFECERNTSRMQARYAVVAAAEANETLASAVAKHAALLDVLPLQGTLVQARWPGDDAFYQGAVACVKADGSVDVRFDDGDMAYEVSPAKLRDYDAPCTDDEDGDDEDGDDARNAPEAYCCPISCELMRKPVIASDGHTYERSGIEAWLATGKRTSPMTKVPLEHVLLIPNHSMRSLIAGYLDTLEPPRRKGHIISP